MFFSYYTFKNEKKGLPSQISKIVEPALQDGVQIHLDQQSCWENL